MLGRAGYGLPYPSVSFSSGPILLSTPWYSRGGSSHGLQATRDSCLAPRIIGSGSFSPSYWPCSLDTSAKPTRFCTIQTTSIFSVGCVNCIPNTISRMIRRLRENTPGERAFHSTNSQLPAPTSQKITTTKGGGRRLAIPVSDRRPIWPPG